VVAASSEENLQPFKEKMEAFIDQAHKAIVEKLSELEECKILFLKTMKFYHFNPKSGTLLEDTTPGQFFEYWTNFTTDFHDIWKKEICCLIREL
jgi:formin 2